MNAPNGFAGPWDPTCPYCKGYMHTGHTTDCPVTLHRERENARLVALTRDAAEQRLPTSEPPGRSEEPG